MRVMIKNIQVYFYIIIMVLLDTVAAIGIYIVFNRNLWLALLWMIFFSVMAPKITIAVFSINNRNQRMIMRLNLMVASKKTSVKRISAVVRLWRKGFFKGNEYLYYDYMSLLYGQIHQYGNALVFSKKANALEFAQKGLDMKLDQYRLMQQIQFLLELKHFDEAEEMLDKLSLSYYNDTVTSANVNISYARVYIGREQPDMARIYIHRAKQCCGTASKNNLYLDYLEASCDIMEIR